MNAIQDSVDAVRQAHGLDFIVHGKPFTITGLLVDLMHFCDHTPGVSWARCLEAAQKLHQKEVREAVDRTPLPSK